MMIVKKPEQELLDTLPDEPIIVSKEQRPAPRAGKHPPAWTDGMTQEEIEMWESAWDSG